MALLTSIWINSKAKGHALPLQAIWSALFFFPLSCSLKCFGLGFAISVARLDIYNMFSLAQYDNNKSKKDMIFSFTNVSLLLFTLET